MREPRAVRWALRLATALTLAFIYVPLLVVAVYAFNASNIQTWPIREVSLRWFERAFADGSIRDAFLNSIMAATGATAIALVLGSMAAFAVHRFRFFGRETISFLVILPIALPGV
ncbi:MAG TPA: ABC transporter permease, partial [Candidatus Limnocylindria bacterium]